MYGVESVPKITGFRGPPAFRLSPTFSRPHGFRVLDIPHVNALSVPKIRYSPTFQRSPTFRRSHSFRRPHSFGRPHIDLFLFLRLIGSLTYKTNAVLLTINHSGSDAAWCGVPACMYSVHYSLRNNCNTTIKSKVLICLLYLNIDAAL